MSKKAKKKDDSFYGTLWTCCQCKDLDSMEPEKMFAHMKEVHGIDTKTTKGTRSMLMHLDGDTWFSSTYEWTVGDLKFTQYSRYKRSKSSLWQ